MKRGGHGQGRACRGHEARAWDRGGEGRGQGRERVGEGRAGKAEEDGGGVGQGRAVALLVSSTMPSLASGSRSRKKSFSPPSCIRYCRRASTRDQTMPPDLERGGGGRGEG